MGISEMLRELQRSRELARRQEAANQLALQRAQSSQAQRREQERLHREDVQRRGQVAKEDLERGPVPELLRIAQEVAQSRPHTYSHSRNTEAYINEDERGRVYASMGVFWQGRHSLIHESVSVREYEDGNFEVEGAKTSRLGRRPSPDALDSAIGRAVANPKVVEEEGGGVDYSNIG